MLRVVQATGIISGSPPLDCGGVGGILIPPTLIPFGVRVRSTGFGAAGARKILQIEQRASHFGQILVLASTVGLVTTGNIYR